MSFRFFLFISPKLETNFGDPEQKIFSTLFFLLLFAPKPNERKENLLLIFSNEFFIFKFSPKQSKLVYVGAAGLFFNNKIECVMTLT